MRILAPCLGLCVFALACKSTDEPPNPSNGGAGGRLTDAGPDVVVDGGIGGQDAALDAPAAVKPTGSFAVWHLYLGDKDTGDVATPDAWKHWGMNLDGQTSTPLSQEHCTLYPGAEPANVKTDGDNGIDNSFGHNIVPSIISVESQASSEINAAIATGAPTLLFQTSIGDNNGGGAARAYRSAPFGSAPPSFDGTDVFPLDSSSFVGSEPGLADAISQDPGASLSGDVLNLSFKSLRLQVNAGPYTLLFTGYQVRVSMTMNADHSRVLTGVVAGAIKTDEAIDEVRRMLYNTSLMICGNMTVEQIISRAQDVVLSLPDGGGDPVITNPTGVPCNAISFGIGFEAVAAKAGPIVSAPALSDCTP
jgi:hypothetical protein